MATQREGGGARSTRRELLAAAARAGLGLTLAAPLGVLAACKPAATPWRDRAASAPSPEPSLPTAAPAAVQDRTMVVGLWTGTLAQAIRERVVPEFERDHGVKVTVEEGISADHVDTVRAEAGNPQHTLIGVDDLFVPELRVANLIARLTPDEVPNMKDVYPEYVLDDGWGLGVGVSWNTLFYNTEKVSGPITSYAAMWDPAYRGRLVLQSPRAGSAYPYLVVAAALATGKPIREAQYQAEAGFDKLRELKPSLQSIQDSMTAVAPLLAQGETWLMPALSRVVVPLMAKGAPVARAEVKEGPFFHLSTAALVANGPLSQLGTDFLNRLVSPVVQLGLSTGAFLGPVNARVALPPELRALVPAGREDASKMIRLDWAHLAQRRAAWLERWNREIAS